MTIHLKERTQEFFEYVTNGGKVDATDWMPEEYKIEVRRVMGFQGLAEIVGGMIFSEWIPKNPSIIRKMMYTAKSQDEMGHAHILIRSCEDIGLSREEIVEGYISGENKLLNIFHYDFKSFEEMVSGMLLQNTAAIVQFQSLVNTSYLPYHRSLRKIMKEEAFHYNLAINMIEHISKNGTKKQKDAIQSSIDLWFPRMLAYFGPSDRDKPKNHAMKMRVKVDFNDTIRDNWLNKIVPLVKSLGYQINDPQLLKDKETAYWSYTMPNWEEVKHVLKGNGPCSEYWRKKVEKSYESSRWIRELAKKKKNIV
ncbi:Phenylacetic acid catabolic protein [Neobacillus niacini]|uniref:Phenylacetic acid catabolic protein n=1 Tax=Neobacillus niacini TaxID=86668 RepID=UPI002FFE9634